MPSDEVLEKNGAELEPNGKDEIEPDQERVESHDGETEQEPLESEPAKTDSQIESLDVPSAAFDADDGIDTLYDPDERQELPLLNDTEENKPTIDDTNEDNKDVGHEEDNFPLDVKDYSENNAAKDGEESSFLSTPETHSNNELNEEPDDDEEYYRAKRELDEDQIEKNLDESLAKFEDENWKDASIEEKKEAISDLRDCVADDLGLKEKPEIKYFSDDVEEGDVPCGPDDYGCYVPEQNTLYINTKYIKDGRETAKTVAHESRHAWQYERAENPTTAQDYRFKENLAPDHYIRPEDDRVGYYNQLVEVDARNYEANIGNRIPDKNRFSLN